LPPAVRLLYFANLCCSSGSQGQGKTQRFAGQVQCWALVVFQLAICCYHPREIQWWLWQEVCDLLPFGTLNSTDLCYWMACNVASSVIFVYYSESQKLNLIPRSLKKNQFYWAPGNEVILDHRVGSLFVGDCLDTQYMQIWNNVLVVNGRERAWSLVARGTAKNPAESALHSHQRKSIGTYASIIHHCLHTWKQLRLANTGVASANHKMWTYLMLEAQSQIKSILCQLSIPWGFQEQPELAIDTHVAILDVIRMAVKSNCSFLMQFTQWIPLHELQMDSKSASQSVIATQGLQSLRETIKGRRTCRLISSTLYGSPH